MAEEGPWPLTVRFPGVPTDSGSHFYVTAFILCALKYLCTKNADFLQIIFHRNKNKAKEDAKIILLVAWPESGGAPRP